jgi:hypothetical protein
MSTPQITVRSPTSTEATSAPRQDGLINRLSTLFQNAVKSCSSPVMSKAAFKEASSSYKTIVGKGVKEINDWYSINKEPNSQKDFFSSEQMEAACLQFIKMEHRNGLNKSQLYNGKDYSILIAHGSGYLLLGPIEQGGEKEIFLGVNCKNSQCVIISKNTLTQGKDVKDFLSIESFNTLQKLSDEQTDSGIVHLIDQVVIGASQFVVQQWCKQGDLFSFMQKNKLSAEQQATFCEDILNIINLFASKRLLPTDIKPDNFFIDNGRVYLGDINLNGKTSDTFSFSAPETILSKVFDIRSVYWSTGLTLYYILCGEKAKICTKLEELSSVLLKTKRFGEDPDSFLKLIKRSSLENILPWRNCSNQGLSASERLVAGMLRYEPSDRLTADRVLEQIKLISPSELAFSPPQ